MGTEIVLNRVAWGACVAALLAPAYALGQERPGSGYAMGGVAVPYQRGLSGEEFQTYVSAPGGTTRSWTFTGGLFATRWLSLEGEVSRTGMMRAREPSRYNMLFDEERRDWFFAGNFRFHLRPGSQADIEPLAGVLVTRHQAWSQTTYESWGLPPVTHTYPRVPVDLPTTLGINSGVDLRLGGRHVAVVPSLRFRWRFAVFGDNKSFSWYPAGFPSWTISPSVMARVDF